MVELNSKSFHIEANKLGVLLCIFYQSSLVRPEEIFLRIFGTRYKYWPATSAYVDVVKCQDVAKMFGIDAREPTILIMREQIVLFCESESDLEKHDVASIIQQVSVLDMKKIKYDIEIERQSQAHLFGRNVCPTAKRTRGK